MIESSSLDDAYARLGGEAHSRERASGGCINDTNIVTLTNGRRLFVKENHASRIGLFRAEAAGLNALRHPNGPGVPEALALVENHHKQYLIVEYIESAPKADDYFEDFGRKLATLHREKRSSRFGFDGDNHIGATPQPNTWADSWVDFFAEHRLMYQMTLARGYGYADASMSGAVEDICARLSQLVSEPDGASIIHGDLWGGNHMSDRAGRATIFDPAAYYAHREADIAMTKLFGGFGDAFYGAYNEVWPLDEGHEERVDLYNLYHMLNHLNLFGTGYLSSVKAIIRRYS